MHAVKTILVPVDFSDCSRAALRQAVGLARTYGARLELLHVNEVPFAAKAVVVRTPDGRDVAMDAYLGDEAQRLLTEMGESVAELADVEHELVVRGGVAPSSIVDRARTTGADIIVMGTQGRSGLSHLLMGSVAEKVLRQAPCPVLIVRDVYPD